jgi:hypothetical protein
MRKAWYPARKSSLKRKWSGVKTVGTVEIGAERMWDVVRGPLGWEEERERRVKEGGKVVTILGS